MFIYILIGVMIKSAGMMNSAENKRFNKILFTFFYPVLMFDNIYSADLGAVLDLRLIIFALGSVAATVIAVSLVVVRIEKNNASRGAMIQAIYRSNFVLMGIMIVQSIFGKEGLPTAAMLVTIVVPFFNVIAVIVLEYFRGNKADFGKIAVNTAKNPLIIGAVVGAVFSGFEIGLPGVAQDVIGGIAAATMPMALIMLGVSIDYSAITAKRKNILICVVGRLLVVPVIGLPLAAAMGFRGPAFVTLLIMMASPTAVSTYPMAVAMDSDGELAGSAIMISTPLSCITLFIWLLIFKNLGVY
ncbi:MAG: AEC family transporter [Mogibacterium sp.]|nr:AEC family transporter [Mogibacterium sp.]